MGRSTSKTCVITTADMGKHTPKSGSSGTSRRTPVRPTPPKGKKKAGPTSPRKLIRKVIKDRAPRSKPDGAKKIIRELIATGKPASAASVGRSRRASADKALGFDGSQQAQKMSKARRAQLMAEFDAASVGPGGTRSGGSKRGRRVPRMSDSDMVLTQGAQQVPIVAGGSDIRGPSLANLSSIGTGFGVASSRRRASISSTRPTFGQSGALAAERAGSGGVSMGVPDVFFSTESLGQTSFTTNGSQAPLGGTGSEMAVLGGGTFGTGGGMTRVNNQAQGPQGGFNASTSIPGTSSGKSLVRQLKNAAINEAKDFASSQAQSVIVNAASGAPSKTSKVAKGVLEAQKLRREGAEGILGQIVGAAGGAAGATAGASGGAFAGPAGALAGGFAGAEAGSAAAQLALGAGKRIGTGIGKKVIEAVTGKKRKSPSSSKGKQAPGPDPVGDPEGGGDGPVEAAGRRRRDQGVGGGPEEPDEGAGAAMRDVVFRAIAASNAPNVSSEMQERLDQIPLPRHPQTGGDVVRATMLALC